ncbi:IPT/TIG domain-containing protein [uncultured Sunxiuqinia sp.]|uniref:IPT/TIG domain-containing protein n=1 Tax=uncultured Sunxiuqinia sp. TaxID=1573825 RepID=UPI002AA65BB6|nr:IPT/TIG domain-containing protein [uncultured Sunxiuqinia sp.]
MKKFITTGRKTIYWVMMLLLALFYVSCSDDGIKPTETVISAEPYDPSMPVEITDFIPGSGGVGQRLVIYGENFGNDPELIHVYIGGKEAVVIGVNSESLYCIVPEKAYAGNIEIYMGDEPDALAVGSEAFAYERKMVVSTLAGYRNERDDQGWLNGHFDDVAGFREPAFMKFDPLNPKHLYVSYDHGPGIYLIDFEDSTVTQHLTSSAGNWNRLRSLDFTIDGEYMVVSHDQWDPNGISTSIMSRNNRFKDPQILTTSRAANGASIHPVNGEMYFNGYEKGEFYRFDVMNSKPVIGDAGLGTKDYETLFLVQDNGWEFNIQIHPSGNYAYIVVVNQHYILRTDYNWDEQRFSQPYLVCGEPRSGGWEDGVGSKVRLRNPYQGVFVKNAEYAGADDEYDFYFTEQHNHDIRILTPQGKVTTFAGRGSSSINPDPWGYVNGDLRQEARFDQPTGLAYNETEKAFYVMDHQNRRLRKIALEDE